MSRFQTKKKPRVGSRKTTNLAGGQAYDREPRTALASLVLTSMVQDTFYQSAEDQLDTLRALVAQLAQNGDLQFAAKAAIYARHTHGLRSITHALAAEIAHARGEYPKERGSWGPEFFRAVVFRPDDMREIAGYWISNYAEGDKKTLPNAMKRGFARKFGEYSADALAKYDGASTGELTLRQLAHLCHPRGGAGSTIYKLRAGKLDAADTHEVALTRAGQVGDDEDVADAKSAAWADLFKRGKVKYLAALRNCRRIIETAPDCLDDLCVKLVSLDDIKGSKVLPFQFLAAHDAVSALNGKHARRVLTAIEQGAELALSNVPKLKGRTLVCLDDSSSMLSSGAPERHKKPAIMGAMFTIALARANEDCDVMLFDEDARYLTISNNTTLFGGVEKIVSNLVGKGTNFHAPFQTANQPYDRIILLSDAQGWMGGTCPDKSLRDYERRHGVQPHVYSWDLVGSTTSQFPAPRIHALAGISDRVFDLMRSLEEDPKAMVNAIAAVNIGE